MASRHMVTRHGSFMGRGNMALTARERMLIGHRMTGRTEWLIAVQVEDGTKGLIYKFNDPQARQEFIDFLTFEDIPFIISERIVPLIPVHDCDVDEFTVKVRKPKRRSTKTKNKKR